MKSSSSGKDVAKSIKSNIISAAHRKIQRSSKSSQQSSVTSTKSNYVENLKAEIERSSKENEVSFVYFFFVGILL